MANFNVSVTQSNEPQPSGIGAGDSTTYTISNPLPFSSYFTLETVKNSNGAYDSNSPKNLQGTLSGDSGITTIVSDDYKAGIVVSPGGGVLTFVPTNAITAATLRLRGTSDGFVSTTPLDADYQAVLDRASTLGYNAPNASQQTLQNTLVEDLKTAGIWSKLDVFYVFATNGDSDYATLNWKSPSSFQATKVNSPTFTENQGFQGDGLSSYLDTNFNPTTHSTVSSQYSIGAGGYYFQKPTSTYDNIIGADNGSNDLLVAAKFNQDYPYFRVNDAGAFRPIFASTVGFYGISRSANNRMDAIFPDGSTDSSSNSVAAGFINSNLTILKWSGTVYSNAEISVVYYGGDLTSEHSDFKTAVDNYIAGL